MYLQNSSANTIPSANKGQMLYLAVKLAIKGKTMKNAITLLLVASVLAGCGSSNDSDADNTSDTLDDSATVTSEEGSTQIPPASDTPNGTTTDIVDSSTTTQDPPVADTSDGTTTDIGSSSSTQDPAVTDSSDGTATDTGDSSTTTDSDTSGTVDDTVAGTGDNTAVPGQSLALDELSGDIISVLAGYRLEQFASDAVEVFAPVLETAIDSTVLAQDEFPFVDRGETLVLPVDQTQYSCAGGGTVLVGNGISEILESSYSHVTDVKSWRFESCIAVLSGTETLIDGELSTVADSASGNRFSTGEFTAVFADLSFGDLLQASATINTLNLNPEGQLTLSRTVSMENFVESAADDGDLAVTDGIFSQMFTNTGFGRQTTYSLNTSGTVAGQLTNNANVMVSTDSTLEESIENRFPEEALYVFTGQIGMSVPNGPELTISANPERNGDGDRQVDFLLLNVNGEQTSSTSALTDFPFGLMP